MTSQAAATQAIPSVPSPPPVKRRGRPPGQRSVAVSPRAASERGRLVAAMVLEVLAGNRSPTQAALGIGVSLARYYVIEKRAIAGLVAACEPPTHGRPTQDLEKTISGLNAENRRLSQALLRQETLVRTGLRCLGISDPRHQKPPASSQDGSRRRRPRRPSVRALRAAHMVTPDIAATPTSNPGQAGTPAPPRSAGPQGRAPDPKHP